MKNPTFQAKSKLNKKRDRSHALNLIAGFQFAFFTNLNALLNSIKTGSITNPPTIP